VVYHHCSSTLTSDQPIQVGILVNVQTVNDDAGLTSLVNALASASVTDSLSGGIWNVSATVQGNVLGAKRNLTTGALMSRTVKGVDITGGVFTVNGTDEAAANLP